MQSTPRNESHVSLLTPPRTPYSDNDVPYRPPLLDKTSLNLKKRHHRRHSSGMPCYGTSEAFKMGVDVAENAARDTGSEASGAPLKQRRSKSLPTLPNQRSHSCLERLPSGPGNADDSWRSHLRRWTMPSKAIPTRGVTMLSSISQNEKKSRKQKRNPSPAVITLRRATSNLRFDNGITFFPPPTFNSTRTSLLSTLLSTVSGDTCSHKGANENEDTSARQSGPENSTWHPLLGSSEQCKDNTAVSPTFTQVDIEPRISLPLGPNVASPRRCSTRYFSRLSVYEVIWDENDTPSGSDNSSVVSHGMRGELDAHARRPSAAVQQLEAQMDRAMAQSRRESSVTASSLSYENASDPNHGRSFQAVINSAFSRLINESALRNLPRSKASKGPRLPPTQMPFEVPTFLMLDDDADATVSQHGVDFFPPLASSIRHDSPETQEQSSPGDAKRRQSPQTADRPRMGSLIGISARKRRNTITRTVSTRDQSIRSSLINPWLSREPVMSESRDAETLPLLSTPNWNGSVLK